MARTSCVQAIITALKEAGSRGLDRGQIIDAVYRDREDGGPVSAVNVIATTCFYYNQVARAIDAPKIISIGHRYYFEGNVPSVPLNGLQLEYAVSLVTRKRSRFRHAAVLSHLRKKLRQHGVNIKLDSDGHYLDTSDIPAVRKLTGLK